MAFGVNLKLARDVKNVNVRSSYICTMSLMLITTESKMPGLEDLWFMHNVTHVANVKQNIIRCCAPAAFGVLCLVLTAAELRMAQLQLASNTITQQLPFWPLF